MNVRYGICFLCVCGASGLAQPNHAATPGGHPMTLNVVVTDKSGKPVTGLQQDDFKLLDNKQPTNILSFQAVNGPAAGPPVEVVLVVDEIDTPFMRVARIREDLVKYLGQNGGKLSRPTSIVLVTDSGNEQRTPPTQDAKTLIANMNQADFGLRFLKRSEGGFYGVEDQQNAAVKALMQVIQSESADPARKVVVWISPGWPLFLGGTLDMNEKELQQLFGAVVAYTEALRQANITLYEVDPGGTNQNEMQLSDFQQFYRGVKGPNQVQIGDLGLQGLAYRSGGRVMVGDNDIAAQIAECAADADAFYRITFETQPGDGPNDFHALDIKIDKPKMTARTEAGYYAQPVGALGSESVTSPGVRPGIRRLQ